MRSVLEDRPPEQRSGEEVARVFEVKQGRWMLERRVVGGWEMPREVGDEPKSERNGWAGQLPNAGQSGDPLPESRRDAEDEEGRRPFREDHVLEEVRRQQVVAQRLERRHRGHEEEQAPSREGADTPALGAPAADGDGVGEREGDDAERRLRVDGPRIRVGTGDGALR